MEDPYSFELKVYMLRKLKFLRNSTPRPRAVLPPAALISK